MRNKHKLSGLPVILVVMIILSSTIVISDSTFHYSTRDTPPQKVSFSGITSVERTGNFLRITYTYEGTVHLEVVDLTNVNIGGMGGSGEGINAIHLADKWAEENGVNPQTTKDNTGSGTQSDAAAKKNQPPPGTTSGNAIDFTSIPPSDASLTKLGSTFTNPTVNKDGTTNRQTYYIDAGDAGTIAVQPGQQLKIDTDNLGTSDLGDGDNCGGTCPRQGYTLLDSYEPPSDPAKSDSPSILDQLKDAQDELNKLGKELAAEEKENDQDYQNQLNKVRDLSGQVPTRPTQQLTTDGTRLTYNYQGGISDTEADTTKVDFPDGRERYVEGDLSKITLPPSTSLRSLLEAAAYVDSGTIDDATISDIAGLREGTLLTDDQGNPKPISFDYVGRNSDGFIAMNGYAKGVDKDNDGGKDLSDYDRAEDLLQTYEGGSRTVYKKWVSLTSGRDVDFQHSSGIDATTYTPWGGVQNTFKGRDTDKGKEGGDVFDDQIDVTQMGYGDNRNLESITTGTFSADIFGIVLGSGGSVNFEDPKNPPQNKREYTIDPTSQDINLGSAYSSDGSYVGTYRQDHDTGETYVWDGNNRLDTGGISAVDLGGTGTGKIDGATAKDPSKDNKDNIVKPGEADSEGDALEGSRRKDPSQNTGDGSFFWGTGSGMDWWSKWFSSPFTGMSGWTSLFGGYANDKCQEGDHAWEGGPQCGWADEFRDDVSQFFCESVIFGSMDCWIAHLCEKFDKADDMDTGDTAFTTTSTGEVVAAAHIEGERGAVPLQFVDESGTVQSQYYYKLSFFAMNPLADENLKISITLKYSGGEKMAGTVELEPSSSYSAMGSTMQIFYSPHKYTEMFMSFSPDLETAVPSTLYGLVGQGGNIESIKNNFVEVGGASTTVEGGGGGAEGGEEGGGEGEGEGETGCDSSTTFCWG